MIAAVLLVVAGFGCGVAVAGWALGRHVDGVVSRLLCREARLFGIGIAVVAICALKLLLGIEEFRDLL